MSDVKCRWAPYILYIHAYMHKLKVIHTYIHTYIRTYYMTYSFYKIVA